MTEKIQSSTKRVISRLLLVFFVLQLLIGLAFVVKSFLAGQEVLHSGLLTQLSNEYLAAYKLDPTYTHNNTPSFSVYTEQQQIPKYLLETIKRLPQGIHIIEEIDNKDLDLELQVVISTFDQQRVVFVSQVSEPNDFVLLLDKTLGFLLSYSLIMVILGVASIWLLRKHLLHPLQTLVENVDDWDFDGQPSRFSKKVKQGDVSVLARSLDELSCRLARYVKRERKVTRNISHELRTPITVISSTLEMIALQNDLSADVPLANHVAKLKRACVELEGIIHAILWLGREKWALDELIEADQEVHMVLEEHINYPSLQGNPIEFDIQPKVMLNCPAILFRILVGNLIKNALEHGQEKSLFLSLTQQRLLICNTQRAELTPLKSKHFGLGLDIVKQVCARMNWHFEFCIDDEDVKVTVRFKH